jgi:aminopeptidase N
MADANKVDLSQFKLWYSQAGTPRLDIRSHYEDGSGELRLQVHQSCPDTPGQKGKQPFLIPLHIGLLGPDGQDLPLQLADEDAPRGTSRTLQISAADQELVFVNLPVRPVPSLLRGFSAPVKVRYPYSRRELAFLFANDSDSFNRWEAGQRLATEVLLEMIAGDRAAASLPVPDDFLGAFRSALTDRGTDPALLALALTLPSETELAEAMDCADPGAIHRARQALRSYLARELHEEFTSVMAANRDQGLYSLEPLAIGRRSLKNLCLGYLTVVGETKTRQTCFEQFMEADNMTDRMAALTCLVHNQLPGWQEALAGFYHHFQDDPLVVDKWFTLQATSPCPETLERVRELMGHPAFTMRNPNRVRSLIGAFAHGNPALFHDLSGAGYAFVADRILELDELNPQVASRLVAPLSRWRRYDKARQSLMKAQLQRLREERELSSDVGEIVQKSLN